MKNVWLGLCVSLLMSSCGVVDQSQPKNSTGNVVGNGGNAVVCKEPGTGIFRSAELLDYYEARILRNLSIKMDSERDEVERAAKAVSRLKHLDANKVEQWTKRIREFKSQASFVSGVTLTSIPDANPVAIPNGCELQQAAIRRAVVYDGESTFLVNKDIWEKLSDDDKAGLILHEVIYEDHAQIGEKTSNSARFLNATLASDDIAKWNAGRYVTFLSKLNSKNETFEWQGLMLLLIETNVDKEGHVDSRIPLGEWSYGRCDSEFYLDVAKKQRRISCNSVISFFPNGSVLLANFYGNEEFKVKDGVALISYGSDVFFHPNGRIQKALLLPSDPQTFVRRDGSKAQCGGWKAPPAVFDGDGYLISC